MVKFKHITLQNFLSYGNSPTTVNLDVPGTTLINGENLDSTDDGVGANGVGKFQSVDSLVKTPDGWIRMGDIQVGQIVQTPDGAIAAVLKIFPQGKQPLYRVSFEDGRSTLAGNPHLWKVILDDGTSKILTTSEISDYISLKNAPSLYVPYVTHPHVQDKNLELSPYLLGLLLSIHQDDDISAVSHKNVTQQDIAPFKQYVSILENQHHGLTAHYPHYYSPSDVAEFKRECIENSMKHILIKLGLYPSRLNKQSIPYQYFDGTSEQQKIDLLAGILDTKGNVGGDYITVSVASKQLARDIRYLVRSIGGEASIHKTINNQHIEYIIGLRIRCPERLFRDAVKKEQASKINNYPVGLRITAITPATPADAQCIVIGHPDHLYITDDFIVTHNSGLINALTYALYDRPVSNISKDNLVNNVNKKNMQVTVSFEKNDTEYKVTRTRKTKAGAAGNQIFIFQNGNDITPDSISTANEKIEQIVGIPYELFVRIVTFSAIHTPFLELPVRSHYAANQTDIIEELFELKTLSKKANALKAQIKESETEYNTLLSLAAVIDKEHDRLSQQIRNAELRVKTWAIANTDEISSIQKKLQRIVDVNIEEQQQYHNELMRLTTSKKEKAAKISELVAQIKTNRAQLSTKSSEIKHLQDAKCPYCQQTYKDDVKIAQLASEIQLATDCIEQIESQLQLMVASVDSLEHDITEISKKITVSDIAELLDIKNKQVQLTEQITYLQQQTNPHLSTLEELKAITLDVVDREEILNLEDLIKHQQFLLKLLTKKDSFVRKSLLNRNIPFLNTRLASYLMGLGLTHSVEFTHDMTAKISQFGRVLDFGNLSHGQQARVNLALSLAFRDVLQSLHDTVNVCMLDEVLDVGLDSTGVQLAAKLLNDKAIADQMSVFIISHRDEIESTFDRKLTIQMKRGFSYAKEIAVT